MKFVFYCNKLNRYLGLHNPYLSECRTITGSNIPLCYTRYKEYYLSLKLSKEVRT